MSEARRRGMCQALLDTRSVEMRSRGDDRRQHLWASVTGSDTGVKGPLRGFCP